MRRVFVFSVALLSMIGPVQAGQKWEITKLCFKSFFIGALGGAAQTAAQDGAVTLLNDSQPKQFKDELRLNPTNGKWTYEDSKAELRYNPMTKQFEYSN